LRRQAFLQNKKPLVVFSPKALLRYPGCVSSFDDFIRGTFLEVIDDAAVAAPKKMIFCSGKIYYDLIVEREKRNCSDVAIVRIEQLYPFPKSKIEEILKKNQQIQKFVWAQEEHENMGAWRFVAPLIKGLLDFHVDLHYAGRPCSAATAAGSYLLHKKQYQKMMDEAFS
jgi:2-oxoglutarate dehydrogenase E1 component